MNITVYGAGYVGLVSAVCFAKLGHHVVAVDINQSRVDQLNQGLCPLYEQDLPELLIEQLSKGRLRFTSDTTEGVQQSPLHIVATGTPGLADGSADLSQVYQVATSIAQEARVDGLLVIKSTVPVGTGRQVQDFLNQELKRLNNSVVIHVVSNPEFLREGTAVYDFLHADRIIIGGDNNALEPLKAVYQKLVEQGIPLLCMSRESSELTKYAANAMLASRISFMNQMSRIASNMGANIDDVRVGIGSDHRIGPHFLNAGIGYGGSCFPKDVRALIKTAEAQNINAAFLEAIESVNELQKNWVIEQLQQYYGHQLQGKTVGIWGLAFKPETDDMRDASSLTMMHGLLKAGAHLRVYDPVAMENAQRSFTGYESITWCGSAQAVLDTQLDALVIATEWAEFKAYNLEVLHRHLGDAPLIDGRNCFQLEGIRQHKLSGYYSVGRPVIQTT